MSTSYPHESPLIVGTLMIIVGIAIVIWRIQNPWVPQCPDMIINGMHVMCDDMDIIPILAAAVGLMGTTFVFSDILNDLPGRTE